MGPVARYLAEAQACAGVVTDKTTGPVQPHVPK
ncbi:hypothetical protein FB563_0143 [Streptomyces puniciscabiei]|uniref:Uncharacterized protein n=1 Tax=Streptomyces puniciscabiei TaxID=164348 RepID=A0A542U858_9ACTN|nr:hypothetical protein FB563_0143 [Streptomyces puniciscabiei]